MNQRKSADRNDLTPNRYSFLLASLERCTLSTLRMYIDRKGWLILEINNILNATQETEDDLTIIISRNISFSTEITLEQKERLYLIAEKCPVSRVLKGKITVNSN
ncbi:OsmC family protein [Flavobacterium urumqiense]|nr:OsmC family protein [Flavobacterium urumqiense]